MLQRSKKKIGQIVKSYLSLVKVPERPIRDKRARWQQCKYFCEHVEKLLTDLSGDPHGVSASCKIHFAMIFSLKSLPVNRYLGRIFLAGFITVFEL